MLRLWQSKHADSDMPCQFADVIRGQATWTDGGKLGLRYRQYTGSSRLRLMDYNN
jgi:hypothetical protein